MGLPEIKIAYQEIIRKPIPEVGTGTVLIIVKESKVKGLYEYRTYAEAEDSKEKYTKENMKYIEDVFKGNIQDIRKNGALEEVRYKPTRVLVNSITEEEAGTLENILKNVQQEAFDFLIFPDMAEGDADKITKAIEEKKESGHEAFAIIATKKASNSADIINIEVGECKAGEDIYSDKNLIPRIAGLCAGTPLEQSITGAELKELTEIPGRTKSEIDTLIDGGKVTLYKKAGKVRIGRGVTSLTKLGEGQGESSKKIKIVRTYKYINNAIEYVISNFYLGKVPNSYEKKLVLIQETNNFLKELAKRELINADFIIDIDIDKQREYLKTKGYNVKEMSDEEIKTANTGDKVFLKITLKAIDAMEDFYINVTV